VAGTLKAGGATAGGHIETSGAHVRIANGANISTRAANGKTGTWIIDPQDFTIAASGGDITGTELSSELASNNVTIKSSQGATSGNGDIFVDDNVSWSSSHTLTLDAYRNIDINAQIGITGAGGLSLIYGDQAQNGTGNAADGDYSFGLTSGGFAGGVNYGTTDNGGTLSINGASYTLLYSMSDVQNINNGLTGNYALATSLDASSVSNWVPIGTSGSRNILNSGNGFGGSFTGLGNTISKLSSTASNASGAEYAGLFGYSTGTIRDIGMVKAAIDGETANGTPWIGALVSENGGAVSDSYVSGGIVAAEASSADTGATGGLAGQSWGTISDSYSTATVVGNDAGGLVGLVSGGTVANSYAKGASGYGYVGGLVGSVSSGTISDSYASSASAAANNEGLSVAGGLVGQNNGTIQDSFAIGQVSIGASGFAYGGGLVGDNEGTISDSYAMAYVSALGLHAVGIGGGLVGYMGAGSISNSYAMGLTTAGSTAGGLVGKLDNGTITNGYWDTETNGAGNGIGIDNAGQSSNVTGLTTAAFLGSLPSGLSNPTWATGTGLFPYLTWQFPSGTPQAISGLITNNGTPLEDEVMTGAYVNGMNTAPALSTISAANGFYYMLFAPGTFAGTQQVLPYLLVPPPAGNEEDPDSGGAILLENMSGSVTNADIKYGYLYEPTVDTNYATVVSHLSTAEGSSNLAALFDLYIDSSASNFVIDSPITLVSQFIDNNDDGYYTPGRVVISSAGSVTQTSPITVTNLNLQGAGSNFTLTDSSNSIAGLLANVGTLHLDDTGSLGLGNVTTSGALTINATGTITLDQDVTAGTTAKLVAKGKLKALGGHSITAGTTADLTSGSDMDISVSATTVDLTSDGSISDDVTADNLDGTSRGAATLSGRIGDLTGFNTHGNAFSLNDSSDLTVAGAINAAGSSLDLTTTGGVYDINIDGELTAGTVDLASAAKISESNTGEIHATTLTGSSNAAVDLTNSKNVFAELGPFTTGGNHAFSFSDDDNLAVVGPVTNGTAKLNIKTVGTDHNLRIQSAIGNGVVTLVTTGKASESSKGAVTASTLNVTANTGIELTSQKNKIFDVGTDKTKSGPNKITL
jgi:hypothetical protein